MKRIDSKIILEERVPNTDRRFGAQAEYYPVYIEVEDGSLKPALFTKDQISVAMQRATLNTEDVPKRKTFLSFIFG